jgi:hypothetical protein
VWEDPPRLTPPPPDEPREPPPEEAPAELRTPLLDPLLEPPLKPPERLLEALEEPRLLRPPPSERDDEPTSEPAREPLSEREELLGVAREEDPAEEEPRERSSALREPEMPITSRSVVPQSSEPVVRGAGAGTRPKSGRAP